MDGTQLSGSPETSWRMVVVGGQDLKVHRNKKIDRELPMAFTQFTKGRRPIVQITASARQLAHLHLFPLLWSD